jgi:hypothetical protein
MGLITCYECKLSVSTNAVCCPNCGNTRFIEQRIAENKRIELENKRIELARRNEREEADKKAQKLGYANAEEQSVSDAKALDDKAKEEQKLKNKRGCRNFILVLLVCFLIGLFWGWLDK